MTPPRVLLLTTYYHPVLGGTESNARRLARFLAQRGCPVQVVTKRIGRDLPVDETIDGIPVHRVRPYGERSPAGKWLMLPFALAALLRFRDRCDVICCVDYRGVGLAALAAGALLRRPVVVQAQTTGVLSCSNWDPSLARCHLEPQGRLAALVKAPIRAIYRRADGFLCISREIEREALECGVPRDRVHYVPNAIDVRRFRLPKPGERDATRREEGWPADRVICVYLGRLSLEKGILDLLHAWHTLDRPQAYLVVVGPDMTGHPWDAGRRAREIVRTHGLEDSVCFCGPRDDTERLLRGADCFVQPSHFEAFGISVIEALATGLATAASAVGGMLDYLRDGENALLFPPEDPHAMADRIRRLVDDGELRARLGRAGREVVEREFDEQMVFGRAADLLGSLAEGGPAR